MCRMPTVSSLQSNLIPVLPGLLGLGSAFAMCTSQVLKISFQGLMTLKCKVKI